MMSIGLFQKRRGLYDAGEFHGNQHGLWTKEFVFLDMIIIPVYIVSALLDAIIFTSIQF